MEKLNELMSKACLASEMGKKGITVDLQMLSQIRDEFWAVEKRAEAAEHERDCHMDIAEHFKARCKEMEQQKPYGYVHNLVDPPGGGVAASIFKEESRHYGRPLFTRPAPAINLAELVPDEDFRAAFEGWMVKDLKCIVGSADPYPAGIEARNWNAWKACRAAILRNIEERTNGENTTTEKVDSLE